MQNKLNNPIYLYKGKLSCEEMVNLKPLIPFSDEVLEFLNNLSARIMKNKEAKEYPDIITFGFFCRKGNLQKLKQTYAGKIEERIGKGLSFHIAPSNVPINFAYTLVVGLLSGNICIVRASSKDFAQTRIICKLMKETFEEKPNIIEDYIAVVSYNRDSNMTEELSKLADARIIWGGDNTVIEIRKSPIKPRAVEVTFADRYSLCVIDAAKLIQITDLTKLAREFFNDTYLFDQNACTSPRMMIWLGDKEKIEKAKEVFWDAIHNYILTRYKIESVVAVDKLMTELNCAVDFENVHIEKTQDNLINRIQIQSLEMNIPDYRCVGGCFLEYDATNLDDLKKIVTDKYQTLSYLGCNPKEIQEWVIKNGLKGIDRIVPIGKTADFGLIWDGYDLITTLSRICYCE
ncbi:MAG TPA: acyl-CoA reductase [Anaerovoracaceae bacterium]|nr:acyl-CoA reductase [Anaerovoracaceae bacterium]